MGIPPSSSPNRIQNTHYHRFLTALTAALTAAMEAPFSTAPSGAPVSQEVLRPEDYDVDNYQFMKIDNEEF